MSVSISECLACLVTLIYNNEVPDCSKSNYNKDAQHEYKRSGRFQRHTQDEVTSMHYLTPNIDTRNALFYLPVNSTFDAYTDRATSFINKYRYCVFQVKYIYIDTISGSFFEYV